MPSILFFAFTGTSILCATNYRNEETLEKIIVISAEENSSTKSYFTTESEIETMTFSDLTKDNLEDFFMGKTPHIALKCEKGNKLPFKFLVKGQFVSSNSNGSSTIIAKETFYIRSMGDSFLFSTNLAEWKSFLGFFELGLGVSLDLSEGTPQVGLDIDLNRIQVTE